MEHLDSKYFERVIAALKQARDSQTIEINENFKRTLRARIEERAVTYVETAEPAWVEWVLRSRYILGGVPVMAALVLVTMAALNHNVPMNSQMLAETGEVQEGRVLNVQADLLSQPAVPMAEQQEEPRLVTFSADLVMPPAEALAAREAYLKGLEGGGLRLEPLTIRQTVPTVPSSPAYVFFEGAINNLLNIPTPKMTVPQVESVTTRSVIIWPTTQVEQGNMAQVTAPVSIPAQGQQPLTEQWAQPLPTKGETIRVEASGRLIEDQPITEVKVAPTQTTISPVVLPEAYIVVDPAKGTFDKIEAPQQTTVQPQIIQPQLTMDLQSPQLPPPSQLQQVTVQPQVIQPQPTLEPQQTDIMPLSTSRLQPTLMTADSLEVDNQPLLAERIYFRGVLREKMVHAVMLALAGRDGNLSRDYYVSIGLYPDNTYRATLYEYGKVKTLLVIAEQRTGEYRVITQINY